MALITVNRALTLLEKGLDQIQHSVDTGVFIASATPFRPVSSDFKTLEELKTRIQSDTDKVEMTFENFATLKEAIAKSNLETKVMFQGKEVSIVRLLAIKLTLKERSQYLRQLKAQASKVNIDVEKGKASMEAQVSNAEANQKAVLLKELEKTQMVSAITAGGKSPAEIIKALEEEIHFLSHEVDMVLSDSNLETKIEIDL